MKKILCAIAAAVIAAGLSLPAMAAQPGISVKNNVSTSRPVTYTYDGEDAGETVKSIKALMTKLKDLTTKNTVLQTLTVTSENDEGSVVDVKLRLSIPEKSASSVKTENLKTPSPEDYSALDYYNIKITTTNGDVVYNYETAPEREEGVSFKDIPLKTMNTEESSDTEIYNITMTINKDLIESNAASKARNLDWSIVSEAHSPKETEAPAAASPTPEAAGDTTAAPSTETPLLSSPSAAPQATVTPSPASAVKADKNGAYKLSKGEYMTGTDVDAGRYTMTGNGKVHVYGSDDILKMSIALKDKNNRSANGVSEYVINLADGERIDVEDEIELAPFTAPSATPSATATTKPSGTSSSSNNSSPSSSSSNNSSSSSSSSKNNPKTGDTAPIAGISAVGITSLALSILLFIKMKKQR